MLHGRNDPVVPYEEGRRLYDLMSEPKTFWEVPGTNHTEAFGAKGVDFRPRLLKFLDEAVAAGKH